MNIDPSKFLEDRTGRYAVEFSLALHEMVVARARGNRGGYDDAKARMERVLKETMGIGELVGASTVLRRAARYHVEGIDDIARKSFSGGTWTPGPARGALLTFANAPTQDVLPRVTFTEAVEDIISRTPRTLRNAAERTARRIAQLYSEGRHIAFARAAEHSVTERAQSLIAQAIREGIEEIGAGKLIKMGVQEAADRTQPWTEAYARMAFRTNLNTAVSAGRFRQAQDQDIKEVVPAFRFDAVGDADTRDNHGAADGIIMRTDNPAWAKIAPPLGYQCRCQVVLVSVPELRRLGRIRPDGSIIEDRVPSTAHPDAGFRHGGRPDLMGI